MAASFAFEKHAMAREVNDPFATDLPEPSHLRYAHFDTRLMAFGPGASAEQAKRALEAHLRETERRMEEAGKLGTALVQQRKELSERLEEVEQLESDGELDGDLRQKLTEIEKEYNEVARESARAFLPKQRVPSNEAAQGSPFAPEGKGGRRSVSPSKFESLATGSPTKVNVPSRKLRNQPANRIHDIEFAAEISTSLISQVRNLQALLAEKDEELRGTKVERARLEVEVEGFQQRMKLLDESEHRYKDENWNLETQIHELIAAQKDATDREKKLKQSLSVLQADKNSTQKELDEAKESLAKQDEKCAAIIKNLEIELGTSRREAAVSESERLAMQRKVEDLTSQNQELAKAFSLQRGRTSERESGLGMSDEDMDAADDNGTPEHSPPPSPVKGTPRHSMLESETLKTSLHHAQRTIQSLRSNVHREKTEKLELKRMLQEARDDLDKLKADPNTTSSHTKKSRRIEQREPKKLAGLGQLGGVRSTKTEYFLEDPDWEDHDDEASMPIPASQSSDLVLPSIETANDQLEAANDTSDAAFETAQERATETEDFQTGAEDLSDDEDAATETEASPSKGAGITKRPSVLPLGQPSGRYSFQSSASTSNDEDDERGLLDLKTPPYLPPKMRLRVSRGALNRRSRQVSEEPIPQGSPGSFANRSLSGTPQPGQSLFAELGDLDGSDDDSYAGAATPSRRSIRSLTPGSTARWRATPPPNVPALPKSITVETGMMTEPMGSVPGSVSRMESIMQPPRLDAFTWRLPYPRKDEEHSRFASVSAQSDASTQHDVVADEKRVLFPSPPTSPKSRLEPAALFRQSQHTALGFSFIRSEHVEPNADAEKPDVVGPELRLSPVLTEQIEPVREPDGLLPASLSLGMSELVSEHITPSAGSEYAHPPSSSLDLSPVSLDLSPVRTEHIEPVPEAGLSSPSRSTTLHVADLMWQDVEPEPVNELEDARRTSVALTLSTLCSEVIMPREPEDVHGEEESGARVAHPAQLSIIPILAEHVEPQSVAESPLLSPIHGRKEVDPDPDPALALPLVDLSLSSLQAEEIEPYQLPEIHIPVSALTLSPINAEQVSPLPEGRPSLALSLSSMQSQEIQPQVGSDFVDSYGHIMQDNSFMLSRTFATAEVPQTPTKPSMSKMSEISWPDQDQVARFVAEDDTYQPSATESRRSKMPESQRPLTELSGNAGTQQLHDQLILTSDKSAQTTLTSEAIGHIFEAEMQASSGADPAHSDIFSGDSSSIGTPSTVRVHHRSLSHESSVENAGRLKGKMMESSADGRRPGSSASARVFVDDVPPLPANHRETIEAARSGSAGGGQSSTGTMGPPLFPASALRAQNGPSLRPRTPNGSKPMSPAPASAASSRRGTPTPRTHGIAEMYPPPRMTHATSRKSSVSSFASEIDTRFNMYTDFGFDARALGPTVDSRMIQAITQTMIGEYLWKYTRKPGRGEMSENRHRRYFWVHPYTRTLYWSDRDPSGADRAELRTKSVPIEAVRVVADDNPLPPGLHRKSLIVISPGRSVKFTCTTGQSHETWFNALSYLLLRVSDEGQADAEEIAETITREDVEEFNPSINNIRSANQTRPGATSLSSYNSRTLRNASPAVGASMNMAPPTLISPQKRSSQTRPAMGTLSRISGYWKDSKVLSGTFGSLRSRSGSRQQLSIYEASQVHDSAEDLREMIERQDRESDRLENVRACCDGKHDVGTLTHNSRWGRHTYSGSSITRTPLGTIGSRS